MMEKLANWMETRWVTPAYSGWLLMGLSIFFFGAASNTMAGWLYVISGTIMAILVIAAVLPQRLLKGLQITRRPIEPVSAGTPIVVEISIANQGKRTKELLQVMDVLPYVLGQPQKTVLETLSPGKRHEWVYSHPTCQRGVYAWKELQFRTAAPLGLFWCRRSHPATAQAVVYPQILPLSRCPLLDNVGETPHVHVEQFARSNQAHEGFTRALRPYRWGDPIRLVHWRTSARYGELRVRELEILTGGEEIIIALDTDSSWSPEAFEQAVITAATLYDYGDRNGMKVGVWTGKSGVVYPRLSVLTILAQVQSSQTAKQSYPHHIPAIWLTSQPSLPNDLADGSQLVYWESQLDEASSSPSHSSSTDTPECLTLNSATMDLDELALQLQQDM